MDYKDKIDIALHLSEAAADRAPLLIRQLLGRKSLWPYKDIPEEEIIRFIINELVAFDPTGEQGDYLPYIVGQLARGQVNIGPDRPEDGPRIKRALDFFHRNSRMPQWTGHKDINMYKNWRQIENLSAELAGTEMISNRQKAKLTRTGAEEIFEVEVPNKESSKYSMYVITEPEALATLGMGTRWCTTELAEKPRNFTYPSWHQKAGQERELVSIQLGSHIGYPITAVQYLEEGPVYMIFRRNKQTPGDIGRSSQLLQGTKDGSQVMNYKDESLSRTSPALDWAMAQWAKQPDAPEQLIKAIRSMAEDYPGRP